MKTDIKCIYCNHEPCGMICTGKGYACPKCLLDRIDYLEKDVERLHENNRLIWCHLPILEMLDLTARKVSPDLPPPINYIDRSKQACIELENALYEIHENIFHAETFIKKAIKLLSSEAEDNG